MGKVRMPAGGGGGTKIHNGKKTSGVASIGAINSNYFVEKESNENNVYDFLQIDSNGASYSRKNSRIIKLDSNHVLVAFVDVKSNSLYGQIITIDKSTKKMTASTKTRLFTAYGPQLDILRVSDTQFLLLVGDYYHSGASTYSNTLYQFTVNYSDGSITRDWYKTLISGTMYCQDAYLHWIDEENKVVFAFIDNGTTYRYPGYTVLKLTGNVSDPFQTIVAPTTFSGESNYTDWIVDILTIDVNHFLIVYSRYSYASPGIGARIITINSDYTVSVSSKVILTTSSRDTSGNQSVGRLDDNTFMLMLSSGSNYYYVQGISFNVDTNTQSITVQNTKYVNNENENNAKSGLVLFNGLAYQPSRLAFLCTRLWSQSGGLSSQFVSVSDTLDMEIVSDSVALYLNKGSGSIDAIALPIIIDNTILLLATGSSSLSTSQILQMFWVPFYESYKASTSRIDGVSTSKIGTTIPGNILILQEVAQ